MSDNSVADAATLDNFTCSMYNERSHASEIWYLTLTVFGRPNSRNSVSPVELPGMERNICAKLLGGRLREDFRTKSHVNFASRKYVTG